MNYSQNRILIVDDESSICNMLGDYFTSLDYSPLIAEDAENAIKLLNSDQQIDLVLTDIDLPGLSGIELLRIVRETRSDIPVVMITGYKSLNYAISAIKNGANDYITKPFELTDVRKIVEKVLRYRLNSQKKLRVFEFTNSMNINFDIPTNEFDAGIVANYLSQFLLNSNFCNKEEYHQFYVAFIETMINAFEHGNLELPSSLKGSDFEKLAMFEDLRQSRITDPKFCHRLIKIAFLYNLNCFSLTITDEGPGFDWQKYFSKDNKFGEVNTKSYGRGFMLIHHIIDEVYFNKTGNSITLVKSKTTN